LELKQASQRCPRRRGLHGFEPAGVRGTGTVTENDREALTQAARNSQSPDQFGVRGKAPRTLFYKSELAAMWLDAICLPRLKLCQKKSSARNAEDWKLFWVIQELN
jgi:hypothetical protein